ncbi:hypothetical protein EI42_01659 [Thermosporothrix hazakensis]|jgi:alkanesulfonate monooxygenase SsuD/methylene tetrahydromethanopterin reductase-like flavin-dependent oxidoreductase (luciferase family)|uniref:Luciferase-like monooxygenase n=2 Tax=Thermosporothrix TaxID=768650 RepID=A0A326UPP2_THEHA|nr:hypothetical protein [Thermosporothrix hazakensis]PZW32567.1 hypothetical protein EI42_01659 [Thermosporothrix hazakensis]BBH87463.1 hypothetical protein KTC_22140 [Thermosporothrix sp. COM3]GCE49920.1 hypothetical protein KTH_47890 [Thermosporothrix hazakensis]
MSIQLGVVLPLLWKPDLPVEACEHIVRVAQEADRSGFASLWLEDHLISPVQPEQALFEYSSITFSGEPFHFLKIQEAQFSELPDLLRFACVYPALSRLYIVLFQDT